MHHNVKDITGRQYGLLTVIKYLKPSRNGHAIYNCLCKCGNKCDVFATALKTGNTLSCGCIQKQMVSESNKTHGCSKTALYGVWNTILSRCYNANTKSFKHYGGKGIKVCDEWRNFEYFKNWADKNNYKQGLSIDRVNNDGDYCPQNCQWILLSDNIRKEHSKSVICIETAQIFISATEASRSLGLRVAAVSDAIRRNTKSGGFNWNYL